MKIIKKFCSLLLNNRLGINIFKTCVFDYDKEIVQAKGRADKKLMETKKLASYAAGGEDKIASFILRFFSDKSENHVTYVDVGSNHPISGNNTYFFYLRGGNGVLIEPNPILCELSRTLRSTDKVINAGISFSKNMNEAYYYMFNRDTLNTFSAEWAERASRRKNATLVEKRLMPLINLDAIFEENFKDNAPDLVSIDVEGLETEVLKTVDFCRHRPKLFVVEIAWGSVPIGQEYPVEKILKTNDYILVANSGVNLFFLAKEHFITKNMQFGDRIVL